MLCKQTIKKNERKTTVVTHNLNVFQKPSGIGWEAMTLDIVDMDNLSRLTPESLHRWVSDIHSRFI